MPRTEWFGLTIPKSVLLRADDVIGSPLPAIVALARRRGGPMNDSRTSSSEGPLSGDLTTVPYRRWFVTLVLGLTSTFAARSQSHPRAARIAVLAGAIARERLSPFFAELSSLGYVEGKNLAVEYRSAARQATRPSPLPRSSACARQPPPRRAHSINSSMRTSSVEGSVKPNACNVLPLTTSS